MTGSEEATRSARRAGRPRVIGGRAPCRAVTLLLAVAAVLLLLPAAPALAHASLLDASPPPGSGLPQAPGSLDIKFSEPLVEGPSRIEVLDELGRDVGDGPTQYVEGDATAMSRDLGLLAPGLYTVRWTTLSPLDGHTLRGRYSFAIGSAPSPEQVIADGPVQSEGWLGLAGRWAALSGLALWIGVAVLGALAVRAGLAPSRRELVARWAPVAVAGGIAASLVSSTLVATGGLAALNQVVLGSQSGTLRLGVAVLALVAAAAPRRPRFHAVLATLATLGEALSGHAASNPDVAPAVLSFAAHLAAVGVWLFAILAAVLSRAQLRGVLAALSPWAVVAAAAVGLTGLSTAVLELSAPGDLVATGYGRAVALKGAIFVLVASAGALHHRRRTRSEDGALRAPVRVEALAAGLALVVAATLTGFPNPPREAEAADASLDGNAMLAAVTDRPAVSVAAADGPFTVGLTLAPPAPGPVEVRVRILPAEPADGLRDVRLRATAPGSAPVAVELGDSCGVGCFDGTTVLPDEATWTLTVTARSNRGPIEAAMAVPLPAEDGSQTLEDALAAMERLRSATVREDLRETEDGTPIVSQYLFDAPDRMRWQVDDGASTRIADGARGYIRLGSDGQWESYEWIGEPYTWPEGFYREFFAGDPTATRILGRDRVDGSETTVIGFVIAQYEAWFKLWVDDDGRIRRLEMLAERHMMDQAYGAFDEPVTVQPPTDAVPRDRSG